VTKTVAVVLAATLGVACMIGPTASDAGTPEAGTATVGDQCTAVVTEFCSQAIGRCMVLGFTLKDCIDADMPMCCTGSVCNRTSTLPASTIDTCKGRNRRGGLQRDREQPAAGAVPIGAAEIVSLHGDVDALRS